jgi:hypothetical protein
MSTTKSHYCDEFGYMQVIYPKFMEDLRSINEFTEKLKYAPSANVVSYEYDILLCVHDVDKKK